MKVSLEKIPALGPGSFPFRDMSNEENPTRSREDKTQQANKQKNKHIASHICGLCL